MKLIFSVLLLIFSSAMYAQPASSDVIMDAAKDEAAASGKNIFVIFHASWCIWCHRMDSAMNEAALKPLFDKNYVIKHLTVLESPQKKSLENPGAEAMLEKYHGKDGGIPFWLIFDKDGNLLADSRAPQADGSKSNVGCPATEQEVEYFAGVLKETSSLNSEQIAAIKERFRKFDH